MSEKSIVSIAIAFSVCFIALLWFLNLNKVSLQTNDQITTLPTNFPTISQKIYKNNQPGFEFTYPSDWNQNDLAILETGDYVYITTPNKAAFRVGITSDNSKTLTNYLSIIDKQNATGYEGLPSVTVLSSKNIVVSGINAILRHQTLNAAGFSVYTTYLKNGNSVYEFTLQPIGGVNLNTVDIENYNQILASIKLSESKIVPSGKKNSGALQINIPYYTAYFIFNNQEFQFDMPQVDYSDKIIYSPDSKFACIEYAVSADQKYSLFNLQTAKTVMQNAPSTYGKCLGWNDDNQLSVTETTVGQNVVKKYLINPQKLSKALVN